MFLSFHYISDYNVAKLIIFVIESFRSLLIAACEKKAIVLFDPITNRQTKAVKNAHHDSVNCVK